MIPIEYLVPDHLREVRDLKILHDTVRDELKAIEKQLLNLRKETLLSFCSEDTLRQFEKEYSLVPLENREAREQQIRSRLSNTQCLTDDWLNKKVRSYGKCKVDRDYIGDRLTVTYFETPIIPVYLIQRELDDLLPMHIQLRVEVKPLGEQQSTAFVHPLQRDYKEVNL